MEQPGSKNPRSSPYLSAAGPPSRRRISQQTSKLKSPDFVPEATMRIDMGESPWIPYATSRS